MGGPGSGRRKGGSNSKVGIIKSMVKKGGIAKNMKYTNRKDISSEGRKAIKASIRIKRMSK